MSLLVSACFPKPLQPGEEGPPPPKETGLYPLIPPASAPTNKLAQPIPPQALNDMGTQWDSATFAILQTELSPAILVRSASSYLGLFRDMKASGIGGPSHLAFSSRAGPRSFRPGDTPDVVDMEECWVLVWFAGAPGWIHWDSPWAVFLQHKPLAMRLDKSGLHLRFRRRAGEVVLMPLYGYDKLPPEGKDFVSAYGLSSPPVRTEDWDQAVPTPLLMRLRYWASASRRFPIGCDDTFQVDSSSDTLTIRQQFHWHAIQDDWNTEPLKLAPISPVLALTIHKQDFPVRFSKTMKDLDLATPLGPYYAAENTDRLEIHLDLLKYIHETERPALPNLNLHPSVRAAQVRCDQVLTAWLSNASALTNHNNRPPNAAQLASSLLWPTKALPVCKPDTLPKIAPHINASLDTARRQFQASNQSLLPLWEPLWTYAHLSGDWKLVLEHWPNIKPNPSTDWQLHWAGFGLDGPGTGGPAPWLALARMAYRVGDAHTYSQACSLFGRELVRHRAQELGEEYIRSHQPWHAITPLDESCFLVALQRGMTGWQIRHPTDLTAFQQDPVKTLWTRTGNDDLARCLRDLFGSEMENRLRQLTARWSAQPDRANQDTDCPLLVRLHSALLNATPDRLAVLGTPDRFAGTPEAIVAACLALFRTSHPIQYDRLIPATHPGAFLPDLPTTGLNPAPFLVQALDIRESDPASDQGVAIWPRITWGQAWRTSRGACWNFGHLVPLQEGTPKAVRTVPLNKNTRVVLYDLPD